METVFFFVTGDIRRVYQNFFITTVFDFSCSSCRIWFAVPLAQNHREIPMSDVFVMVTIVIVGIALAAFLTVKVRKWFYRAAIHENLVLFAFAKSTSERTRSEMEVVGYIGDFWGRKMGPFEDLVAADLRAHVDKGHLKETPCFRADPGGMLVYSQYTLTRKGVDYLETLNVPTYA